MNRPTWILASILIFILACATPPLRSPSSSAARAPAEGVGGGVPDLLAHEDFEPPNLHRAPIALPTPVAVPEPTPALQIASRLPVQEEMILPEPMAAIAPVAPADPQWSWPLDEFVITQRFHPASPRRRAHRGIDLAADEGTPIRATAPGRVIQAGWGLRGYGKWVVIDHGNGYTSVYAHCSEVLVDRGFVVQRGDVIAEVGDTGRATGPHLHFEIRRGGEFLIPRELLPTR